MNFYEMKSDWPEVKKRWEAWWNFELYDRPLLQITAPKSKVFIPAELRDFRYEETDFARKYTDPDYMTAKTLYEYYGTWFGGEALSVLSHGWSVGHALVMGCEPKYAPDTIWTDPLPVEAGRAYPEIRFDENNHWWQKILSMTRRVAQGSAQRYFVMPTWGNHAGDNLALCRGGEALLCDLIEDPDWVKNAVQTVSDAMLLQFEKLFELAALTGLEGTVNYVSCWSPKKTIAFDCDFSCMISPAQFRDIFLPPLLETMWTVDHCLYHLDGVAAMKTHLDTLLAVKEINAFQWLPGAGHEEIREWIPLLQKMQAHKKSIVCYARPEEVLPLLQELRGEGLCVCTRTDSEESGQKLLEAVARMYSA